MGYYFPDSKSHFARAGWQPAAALSSVAMRYVGHNPPHPLTFRAFARRELVRGKDFRYEADFDKISPGATPGQLIYAWARYLSATATELKFDVSCYSPMVIYCNGAVVFKSNIVTERYPQQRHTIFIPVQAGWNDLVIRFEKTVAGFGGVFGTWLGKHAYYFLMPTPQRNGQEGWIYTDPLDAPLANLPGGEMTEEQTGLRWHPKLEWNSELRKVGQLRRIYGKIDGGFAIGWTRAEFHRSGDYRLIGNHAGSITVWIGNEQVHAAKKSGKIDAKIRATAGAADIWVKCQADSANWGFELSIADGKTKLPLFSPCNIKGSPSPWIFSGPFANNDRIDFAQLADLNTIIRGKTYWRLDAPETWVRQYNDNPLYGQWNYPLGVTLRGLLQAGQALGQPFIDRYVVDHMKLCIGTFSYAIWDREQFGGATNVLPLLTSIDSLDDCGSFASALLEAAKHATIDGVRPIADYVAEFISKKQDRLADGSFCRRKMMHIFHKNTQWADDLYMSVPFLCRYAELTGDGQYLDDAARQFEGFKSRLFIPHLKLMSHIYDLDRDKATQVPWGRGNGWTLFSLAELLTVLPKSHARRANLLKMFRELCTGVLPLQDDAGMWHQVLTHPDAYPETSCTSMFAYAFARGVRLGWFEKPRPYIDACLKAWKAITVNSIDETGNVHGVCRGSEFSFTPNYYKFELLPNLNDTHGVGIVLLAGVEVSRLQEFLKEAT